MKWKSTINLLIANHVLVTRTVDEKCHSSQRGRCGRRRIKVSRKDVVLTNFTPKRNLSSVNDEFRLIAPPKTDLSDEADDIIIKQFPRFVICARKQGRSLH